LNESPKNLSNENDCPDRVAGFTGLTRRNISFIKNPTSSLPLLVFDKDP